jgi:hypothetical protein
MQEAPTEWGLSSVHLRYLTPCMRRGCFEDFTWKALILWLVTLPLHHGSSSILIYSLLSKEQNQVD